MLRALVLNNLASNHNVHIVSVLQMLIGACGPDVADLPEWCPQLYEEAGGVLSLTSKLRCAN